MAYIDYEDDETTLLPGHDRKWPDYCSVGFKERRTPIRSKDKHAHRHNLYEANYRMEHRDQVKATMKRYYYRHREQILRWQAEYREKKRLEKTF